jgi:hypothetical protein
MQEQKNEAVALPRAPENHPLLPSGTTYNQIWSLAKTFAASNCMPSSFGGKAETAFVAILMGLDIGLKPAQAMQSIYVVNGKPSLYGDGLLAVIQAHREFEDCIETIEGEGDERKAVCVITRNGRAPVRREFSVADARKAALWEKNGPWTTNPNRMLQMRARAFAARDSFADVLMGISMAEEQDDIRRMHSAVDVTPGSPANPVSRSAGVTEELRAQAESEPEEAKEPEVVDPPEEKAKEPPKEKATSKNDEEPPKEKATSKNDEEPPPPLDRSKLSKSDLSKLTAAQERMQEAMAATGLPEEVNGTAHGWIKNNPHLRDFITEIARNINRQSPG